MVMAVSAAVLGVATSAMAQKAGPKGGGGLQGGKQGQQVQRLQVRGKLQKEILEKLNLTADQKSKWEANAKEMRAEMEKLRAQNTSGQKPDRKAMMEKMKGYQDKMMAILTPKQQEQYKKLMEEAVAKYRKENGGGEAGKGGKKGGGGGGL